MITYVNVAGDVQDLEPFRARLIVPPQKQDQLRTWVKGYEDALNACKPLPAEPGFVWYPDELKKLVKNFVWAFAYTQNLLDEPYVQNPETQAKLRYYHGEYLGVGRRPDSVNDAMYAFEKVVRAGLDVALTEEEERNILAVEDNFYGQCSHLYDLPAERLGNISYVDALIPMGYFVKMFSRHRLLGLPTEMDPKRKQTIEEVFRKSPGTLVGNWVIASVLRAGLEVPAQKVEYLDECIRTWVEQEPELVQRELDFVPAIFKSKRARIDNDREGYVFEEYVTNLHHLRRVLATSPEDH